ncbi:TPA: hypothetical protein U2L37_000110 [Burkholderia multivorans]|nr:hypothetical protein [Burkholderia multivorans]HEM7812337.1 hypothetical protein [Burkholderia multivorans]HEM7817962.1 hypothetical protein [Burkholderia multivorans]HEM7823886.1 hypothetical protein [Burkholderia multivorans]
MNKITITVSGRVGVGKSALCGEIEIMCRALGLQVEWTGGQEEKNLTQADWTEALEMYRPEVVIVEQIERVEPVTETHGAQASAWEGLTYAQREAIEYAARWLEENVSNRYAYTAVKQLRTLLAARAGEAS